ncbi:MULTISPECIES: D-alanyl-D-alanine carboxypeptidase [Streptomyces]|uniref:serine-type D-Ala-D-Ala carboxypeptidase n=1 Tax=Streptomyces lienomycini TaxID=284035 RepID=A0ABV9WXG7_9ACTN|nr:D-alanyl-D-alanine carboxypeptidase [Streptomyces lienomycini]
MEEASVAGESPDRSKQRESSEEPTSGSAGPVPEARTGTSEPRDPRLTVAREDAERSAGAGSGSRGGVDTATRVLSVRETEAETSAEAEAATDVDAETEAEAEEGGTSERTGTSEGDGAEPAAAGDGRLRDAVAAWVATADERAAADARLGDADGSQEAGAASDAPGRPEGEERPSQDAEGREKAASAAEPGSRADADAGAASDGTAPGADAASDTEAEANVERTPAAASASDAKPEGGPESGAGSKAAGAPESGAGSEAGGDPKSGPGPKPDSASKPGPDSDARPDGDPESGSGSKAEDAPKPESKPGPDLDARPEGDPVPGASPEAEGDPESGPGPKLDSASKPDADAKPEDAPKPGSDPKPGPRSGAKPESGSVPESESGAESESDGGDAVGGEGGRGVDQPTAVFKAPRLDKPAVDQPTTMLKLGDAAAASKKAGKGDDAPAPTAPAEGDAERTSRFVALRHPDDASSRKPPQAAVPATDAPKPPQAPRTGVTAARSHVGPDRTSQQPLPPKPPLDLLAELTNTPPPPETPLRTTVRRVKIWTPLVLLLLIALGVAQSMRPLPAPTLELTAQDSFTFDGGKPEIPWPSSGQAALDVQGIGTFGSSGEQKPLPIASVAKVMTAYVILRDHPLKSGAEGPKIKIDQKAEDQSDAADESIVRVYAGDSFSQREALEAVLIASANNVARLLARWDAGSEEAFAEKMNAAAKDLGMTNTTYTDPSGLKSTTVSTAVDQVKLAKAAMKEPAFREVSAMMSYDDYKGVNHSNWNQLVGHNDVVGIKTGTSTAALGNLVFAAQKEIDGETRTVIGAVVRQPDVGGGILAAALDSSDKLIRAAQDTLQSSTIVKKGAVVGYVDDGLGNRTPVVATQDVKAVGWGGLTVKLTFDADEVPHTAKAGTKVGSLTVGDGGTSGAVKVPVALRDDLAEPGLGDKLTRLG